MPFLSDRYAWLSQNTMYFCPRQVDASSKLSSLSWRLKQWLMNGLGVDCDEIIVPYLSFRWHPIPKGQKHCLPEASIFTSVTKLRLHGLLILPNSLKRPCISVLDKSLPRQNSAASYGGWGKADERPRCKLWWKRRPQRLLLLCVHVPHNGCGVNNFVLNRK